MNITAYTQTRYAADLVKDQIIKFAKSFLAGATQFWASIANKIILVNSKKL